MDMTNKASILAIIIIFIHQVSGEKIPKPENLEANILDGEVVVHWKHPADAPPNSTYNVQMSKYVDTFAALAGCTGITKNYCDLSNSISDYRSVYKVRVQLVTGDKASLWASMKFSPNLSDLQPPSFTLWATSSTLVIFVHQKPILTKLFAYGLTYTIYLEETDTNKNTTAFLNDDNNEKIQKFTSLHWGKEYCVSIMAEANAAPSKSSVSPRQCLYLPEQEWFITAVSSLSVLGVMALFVIMAAILMCYLNSPGTTPTGLKSPVTGWLPLSVKEDPIEVVTDRGWFLSSYRAEQQNCDEVPANNIVTTEKNEHQDRRTSIESSGLGMESSSVNEGSPPLTRKDSGCGSLGSSGSSASSRTVYPQDNEGSDGHSIRKLEDSGVAMTSKLDSSSMDMDKQCNGLLKDSNLLNYHSQSPSAEQISVCDDEEMFKQILPDPNLAEVVTGYRAGPQSCICSGAGQCTWCQKQGHCRPQINKLYGPLCIDAALLAHQCGLVDSYKGGAPLSGYTRKNPMNTVLIDELRETILQISEPFPVIAAMSGLPLTLCGQDFNTNMSLSLCDVQLQAD